jgi:hypothetical protein
LTEKSKRACPQATANLLRREILDEVDRTDARAHFSSDLERALGPALSEKDAIETKQGR